MAFCVLSARSNKMYKPPKLEEKQIQEILVKYHTNNWTLTDLVRIAYDEGYTTAYNEIVGDVTEDTFD